LIPVGALASKTSNTIGGPEVISEVFPDESDPYERARGNGNDVSAIFDTAPDSDCRVPWQMTLDTSAALHAHIEYEIIPPGSREGRVFVELSGQRLQVVSFGNGPRILLAHGGWVGSWELWQQPFELMSPDWRCVSYDHRGSGESPTDPQSISPHVLVDDLFAVMDHLDIERCVVAGESLGAVVVLQAAHQAPERFDGLVIVAGAPVIAASSVGDLIAGSRSDYPATVAAFVKACVPAEDGKHLRRWGRNLLNRAEPEAAARLLECYLDADVPEVPLEEIATPALVIHSKDDAIVPSAAGKWIASRLPDATLVELEDGGHVPTITRPSQVVDAIRARFDS
jgi:pimeloyl-ACP methyl ester carboxylesterase